jgi:hypothetical protein
MHQRLVPSPVPATAPSLPQDRPYPRQQLEIPDEEVVVVLATTTVIEIQGETRIDKTKINKRKEVTSRRVTSKETPPP